MLDEKTRARQAIIRAAQGARLKQARKAAKFRSANAAALRHGWAPSSYRAHESGGRTIGQDDAERYARAFRTMTAQQILFEEGAEPTPPPPEPARLHQEHPILIGRRITVTREARNILPPTLAKTLRVSTATLERWERGEETPEVLPLMALCRALSVPLEWIVRGANLPDDLREKLPLDIIEELGA